MSSNAVHMLQMAAESVAVLMADIEDADGVITEEQENQLKWLAHNEELALTDIAKAVKELEARAERLRETRKEWNEVASKSIHEWEERAGRFRVFTREGMVAWKAKNGKATLRSPHLTRSESS